MRLAARAMAVMVAAGVWSGSAERIGMAELGLPLALAADEWKKEFEDICAKTQDAMTLPTEDLKSLVARCDALKPAIDALDESTRKVYSRRLKACRELYQYVIDYREQQDKG